MKKSKVSSLKSKVTATGPTQNRETPDSRLRTVVPGLKSRVRSLALILTLGLQTLDSRLQTCRADLSAVVSPGYTFNTTERATSTKLNRLGNPTITITGTVGGTNANIAANSINGTMMVLGFPGSNLTWDASSPRKLVITNDGVNVYQLNSNAFGLGLSGGSGSQVRVNVDTNTVQITNSVITLNLTTLSNLVAIISTNIALYQVTNADAGSAAGWAKIYGTNVNTTYAPLGNYNVSNVVRTATGNYQINFTNAMPTTNYAIHLQIMDVTHQFLAASVATQSTNSFTFTMVDHSATEFHDPQFLFVQIRR